MCGSLTPTCRKIVLARFALEAALRDALQNQLALHYQTQLGEEGQISGVPKP